MNWCKRIIVALMLAIAAFGQLPLWLHHLQCHCHVTCGPETCGPVDLVLQAGSPKQHDGCGHANCPFSGHAESEQSARRIGPTLIHSTGNDSHDCAACYLLSQLTIVQAIGPAWTSSNLIADIFPQTDRILDHSCWSAYSSRAPPGA